ncbi:MAG TPA: hypothetical protein VLZ54_11875 [Arenibacter sp.]|nr:hypothetical protein [Arenibacter sp.]
MTYFLPISMGRLTAVMAANSVIWSFFNPASSGTNLRIKRVSFTIGYDGVSTPESSHFQLVRFSGAALSGGTTLVPAKANSKQRVSVVPTMRQSPSTPLVTTGAVIEATPLMSTQNQRDTAATTSEVQVWGTSDDGPVINPGEGLCLRIVLASVIGDYLSGMVSYLEEPLRSWNI